MAEVGALREESSITDADTVKHVACLPQHALVSSEQDL